MKNKILKSMSIEFVTTSTTSGVNGIVELKESDNYFHVIQMMQLNVSKKYFPSQ